MNEEQETIDYLKNSVSKIAEIVGKKTLVILGRDAWVLVPMLRNAGVKTQYFLYSRLQIGDNRTKEAWLREVPEGSFVLDTGYAGSIFNDIKTFDPSIKGILMSSTGSYPEIQVKDSDVHSRSRVVGDIEGMPKIIGRSTGFDGFNTTVKRRKSADHDVDSYNVPNLKSVIDQNHQTLKQLGLSDEDADKYKNFSGVPLRQRLGHSDFVTHFMDVEKSRKNTKSKTQEPVEDRFEKALQDALNGSVKPWTWDKGAKNQQDYMFNFLKKANELYRKELEILKDARYETENSPRWDTERVNAAQYNMENAMKRLKNLSKFITLFRHHNYLTSPYYDNY